MQVKLIQATPNAGKMIADIASICYGRDEAENPEKLLKNLYKLGHHSTLEHAYYTFKIEGVSRALLAQLTRHRHASFTVESQRYTKYTDGFYAKRPTAIGENPKANEIYMDVLDNIDLAYRDLLKLGIKAEDARSVLPNATVTNLYMSCNLRELIHIHQVRTSKGAQQEIKDLVNKMVDLVTENEPGIGFMFKEED